jgi:biopolymer transport protein ExbB/TolQ
MIITTAAAAAAAAVAVVVVNKFRTLNDEVNTHIFKTCR